jgi:hypothetical protein
VEEIDRKIRDFLICYNLKGTSKGKGRKERVVEYS